MEKYDPMIPPVGEDWLALDEDERILMVRAYHDKFTDPLPEDNARELHAVFHVLVENQIALSVNPVPATVAKLMRQGLDRHDSLHAIASVMSEDIFDLYKGNIETFNPVKYRHKLEKLTAKRWRKGQY